MMLKIWYSKTQLQSEYQALCKEKAPLELRYNDKLDLITSLHKQALKLEKTLENFQSHLTNYAKAHPDQTQPLNITYNQLLKIEFDDPFWNDGVFTNNQEPWAIDLDTQHGMRQLAFLDRTHEEVHCLGWEARRSMRWAIASHMAL
ncbi:hypothetical protein CROQUDRAFT_719553 [Cronartium quercuum f. sp. fusiforme G11]|uniref:Uncharacterized protein n=1 Tax=Cronartium quercuum f. sp. fusiforme G11 TaxID=708437 RepID=A0A9P6NUN1_9BASI|nr:hypothetical protein CROQUDRAFT_719553 [Cronartium quercuum f. sp. fusiforme G11]